MTTKLISTTWYLEPAINEYWAYMDNVFTAEECEKIKNLAAEKEVLESGMIVNGTEPRIKEDQIRKGNIAWLSSSDSDYYWIFQRCTSAVIELNKKFWNFDLKHIEGLQYTAYDDQGDHYSWHMDMMYRDLQNRKLSFSIHLDDASSYQGCDLEILVGKDPAETRRGQGTMIVFPSYILHRVTPIQEGSRHSLVGWVCGPRFR